MSNFERLQNFNFLTRLCSRTCSVPSQHLEENDYGHQRTQLSCFFPPSAQFHPNNLLPGIESLKGEMLRRAASYMLHL